MTHVTKLSALLHYQIAIMSFTRFLLQMQRISDSHYESLLLCILDLSNVAIIVSNSSKQEVFISKAKNWEPLTVRRFWNIIAPPSSLTRNTTSLLLRICSMKTLGHSLPLPHQAAWVLDQWAPWQYSIKSKTLSRNKNGEVSASRDHISSPCQFDPQLFGPLK